MSLRKNSGENQNIIKRNALAVALATRFALRVV
jgi:hypothetical protein